MEESECFYILFPLEKVSIIWVTECFSIEQSKEGKLLKM